ncbi:MAG TPA: hypothetical protein VGM67_21060 [Gemmatimonadaceae bacterium]|jgi:hypothetical protein
MTDRILRPKSAIALFVAASLAIAGAACSGFTGVPASLDTFEDSGVVYPLNGAPPGSPSALYIFSGELVPSDANFTFDVAFDVDSAGRIVVLPEPAVASGLAPIHTVSLQAVAGTYDALDRAPRSGYRADTALVAAVNQVIMVQSQDENACSVSLSGTTLYAKLVITAVDPVTHGMSIKYATNPNCGFVSFAPGLPKD